MSLWRTALSRRSLLKAAAFGLAAGLAGCRFGSKKRKGQPAQQAEPAITPSTAWLGPAYWANRLQDWRLNDGRLECVAAADAPKARTVAILTAEIVAGSRPARLRVRTGTLAGGDGFSGFLIGAGGGKLDYRAAALVQGASGTGGGMLCVYSSDGQAAFRDHTNEARQLALAKLPARSSGVQPARDPNEDVELRLDIAPQARKRFQLTLSAAVHSTGAVVASATMGGVPESVLLGGIALVSSPLDDGAARYWFRDFTADGGKVAKRPERALGPIIGCLYTLNGTVLKLSAQFVPLPGGAPVQAQLQYREPGGSWRDGPTARIGYDYTAIFRVDGWDPSKDWEYQVVYATGTPYEQRYGGTVRRDPADEPQLVIGVLNCTIHAYRPLDGQSDGGPRLRGERHLGLYTADNLYFPYREVVAGLERERPDMLAALGDQYYEHRPTRKDTSSAPVLDALYRYYLWLWAFGELTRRTPTVTLVDDHDVFQPNLWGDDGAPAPGRDADAGGYVNSPEWVNMVTRMQTGHNPDPYDPAPVLQGIRVYYGAFRYGGVSFAIVEDRKFKPGNQQQKAPSGVALEVEKFTLLGDRQERFLAAWARMDPGLPKVCFSETLWACLQTDPQGEPRWDADADAYPAGRRSALRLLKRAGALLISGDQHLGSLVRHGIDTFTDGPVQFTAPATGSAWQRWFEPATPLRNGTGTRNTGDFTDRYANKLRVLAVANPRVDFATYRAGYPGATQNLGDRALKREGYGLVRVDKAARQFVIECWPWNGGSQFPGWPYRLPFTEA